MFTSNALKEDAFKSVDQIKITILRRICKSYFQSLPTTACQVA